MTRKGLLLVPVAVLLAGCAAPAVDEDSPRYHLPVGSTVVLQQELAVPEGQARVFLQGGAVVAKARLNGYRPHCNFEQRAVSDGSARIAPERFTVTEVQAGEDFVVQRRRGYVYAALRPVDDDSPGMVKRYYHYTLASSTQPQVLRLTCHGGYEIPGVAQLPTLAEMRAALGKVVELEVKTGDR